jgi:antitoxin VapB
MNAPANIPREIRASVFKSNRSQAVRIPKELEFAEGVKKLIARRVGRSLILTPPDALWDDFFDEPGLKDFPEREPQGEYEVREEF